MIIHEYTGVLAEIVDAINDAGGPPKVRRIELTADEMREVWTSNAFKTSVSNYYGSTSAPTLEGIIADREGNIISMYLNGVLICVGPWAPTGPYADLTWAPLTTANDSQTSFKNEGGYLFAGTGNPSTGMVVGSNADIELALAVRKVNDPTNYASGNTYNIELAEDEAWTFVVSVGSKNAEIYNPLDMYNIRLIVDTDPLGTQNTQLIFTLASGEIVERGVKRDGLIWYRGLERAITDASLSPQVVEDTKVGFATQTIQQMRFDFIRRFVPSDIEKTANGSFLGTYNFTLEATPKFGNSMTDAVSIQAIANVVKKS